MSMIKFTSSGSWSIHSKKDPRWNCSGWTESCGGFVIPYECEQALNELKKKFGKPPKDLEWSYMKD